LLEGHFFSRRVSTAASTFSASFCSTQEAEVLGAELAARMKALASPPDLVVAPALGGILVAHEVARALGVRGLFAERQDGKLRLRRGFNLAQGERCFVVEDVVTTGGSPRETMEVVLQAGGIVTAAGSLIDRTEGNDLGVPRTALAVMDILLSPENCLLCSFRSNR
jgi:orotate phosphoribosyltransferase